MSANIEELVRKHSRAFSGDVRGLRNALTEQAETHARELRAYEATVANLEQRMQSYVTVGDGLVVYGTFDAVKRVQLYILLDSNHPVESADTRKLLALELQKAEQRIRQLGAEQVPEGWAFSSADFSLVASGRGDGRVALQRDEAGMKWWHSLPQELKDDDNGPALYVVGRGMTFTDAMNDACQNAMLAAVATQEQV